MQFNQEHRKELKETSTGGSNENQEISDQLKEELKAAFRLDESRNLNSPKFDSDNTSNSIRLVFGRTHQVDLPEKFMKLTETELVSGVQAYFAALLLDDQTALKKSVLQNVGKSTNQHECENDFAHFIEEATKRFKRSLDVGELDMNYEKESKLASALDHHFYDVEIAKNFRKAAHNYSNQKNIVKLPGFKLKELDWKNLVTSNKMDEKQVILNSDESIDSDGFNKINIFEVPKSLTNENTDKDFRTKKTPKKLGANLAQSTTEEIKNFQNQELERYNNPTEPYIFTLKNGDRRWVAPVCKKTTELNTRPRDHHLLISERPSSVTILSLVRDATSKLPKGYGTRLDICELLRESQFITNSHDDERMSSVVSGALDRLHYEKDPCVRYDTNRKLWIYLHVGRFDKTPLSSEKEGSLIPQMENIKNKKVKTR